MRYRLEVYDALATTHRGTLRSAREITERLVLRNAHTLTFKLGADDPGAAYVAEGAVLRLEAIETGATSVWRVAARAQDRTQGNVLIYDVTAYPGWTELGRGTITQAQAAGRRTRSFGLAKWSPLALLRDFVLPSHTPFGISFALGNVEPVQPVSLTFADTSGLAGARMLEQALQDSAGVGELAFRLQGDGRSYAVDLLNRTGRSPAQLEIRHRHNLVALTLTQDGTDAITRLYARGAGMLSLADAEWTVGGVGADGLVSFTGGHPVFESGAHVGKFFYVPGRPAYLITASSAAAGTINVGGGAPSIGDRGWLALDAAGTRLDYLESPAGVAERGVIDGFKTWDDIPDADNRIPNPDLTLAVGGLPVGVTRLGNPTVTAEGDMRFGPLGGLAWRVAATAAEQGFLWDAVYLSPASPRAYVGLLAALTPISGRVRMELRAADGTRYPVAQQRVSQTAGVYTNMGVIAHDQPLPAGWYQLALVAHDGPAEFVVDAVMVTPVLGGASADAGQDAGTGGADDGVPPWIEGSGARLLWARAVAELAERRKPATEWVARFVDLHELEPGIHATKRVDLGDDVAIADAAFGYPTLRVIEIAREPGNPAATQLVLAAPGSPRLREVLGLSVPGERVPGRSIYGAGPSPRGTRVQVGTKSFRANSLTGTFRLTIDDPDHQLAEVRFYAVDGAGVETGPFPAHRAPGGGVYERDIALDGERLVYVRAEVALNGGQVLRAASPGFDSDGLARITDVRKAAAGQTVTVQIDGDADTTEIRTEEKVNGAWAAYISRGPGSRVAFDLQAATTGKRVFRAYGMNAAGEPGPAYGWEMDQYVAPVNTVTADLSVTPVPNQSNGDVQAYSASATNPATGAALPVTVTLTGCTGTVDGTPFASPGVLPADKVLLVAKPAYASADASVEFRASVAGGGSEATSFSISPRGKTSFGPSLDVKPTPGAASWSIAWTGTPGAVTLSVNGAAAAAPPASPITVARGAAGEGGKSYAFRAVLDAQTITTTVTVPPLETPQTPERADPPVHGSSRTGMTDTVATWQITGTVGAGGVGPVQARVLSETGAEVLAWAAVPFSRALLRPPRDSYTEFVELRDNGTGRVSERFLINAPASSPAIGAGGGLRRDVPYEGSARRPQDIEAAADRGATADDDLAAFAAAGTIDRANRRVRTVWDEGRGVAVPGAQAAVGARLLDPSDIAVRLPATEVNESASRKWAAQSGATVGARAGVNLVSAAGLTLGDAAIITAQGTAADTAAVGGRGADMVRDEARLGRANIGASALNECRNGGGEEGELGAPAPGWSLIGDVPLVADATPGRVSQGTRSLLCYHPTATQSRSYQTANVRDGEIILISAVAACDALVAAPGGQGSILYILPSSGVTLTSLDRSPGAYYPTTYDPYGVHVGLAADSVARDYTPLWTRFLVHGTGTIDYGPLLGYGGGVQGRAWWDRIAFERRANRYELDRSGLGSRQYEPVTNGNFRTWDPNYSSSIIGVNLAWGGHTVRFGLEDVLVPSGSFSNLPGDTDVYPWYDRSTGQVGWSLNAYQALGGERVPLKKIRTAVNVSGIGGGSQDPISGSAGGGSTAKV